MRYIFLIVFLLLLTSINKINGQVSDSISYYLDIEEITIRYRPGIILNDVGSDKSRIDSMLLRENITTSMADLLSSSNSVFIKSYGRATVSTASFRGTTASHTKVSWNGMIINSPMLGMVDLSLIPSFFVDNVTLYKGSETVNVPGGGFGGYILMETLPKKEEGFHLSYLQGVGSFKTFDQYLSSHYGNNIISGSTRFYYVTSENNFKYTNYRKKVFITDENGNITESYFPTERNLNGSFADFHFLQELYIDRDNGSKFGLSLWIMDSRRGIPSLNVDYRQNNISSNRQDEISARAVGTWDKKVDKGNISTRIGYSHTEMGYLFQGDSGFGIPETMVDSKSLVNSLFFEEDIVIIPDPKWKVKSSLSLYQHFVNSIDKALIGADGRGIIGYRRARTEITGLVSLIYKPFERLGLELTLKEELYGHKLIRPVPALFIDYIISRRGDVRIKGSIARNYRYPTLNDLYFMPGGNDTLRSENGRTIDLGVEFENKNEIIDLSGEITFFESKINDWILWLPTYKGFWSPQNIKEVKSYGLESKGKIFIVWAEEKSVTLSGNFTVTRSINKGKPMGPFDLSAGKQLPYIPVYSSSVIGRIKLDKWHFSYKWIYYSERFTTTGNMSDSNMGVISDYYMSDISVGYDRETVNGDFLIRLKVNNLFNEEYESVLSRPMAGINYTLSLQFVR